MTAIRRIFDFPYYQLETYNLNKAFTTKYNGEWQSISTQEYIDKANAISRGLLKLGVQPNDKIAVISTTNRTEWNVCDIGILQVGAQNVPIYPTISKEDYEYILNHSEATYCFVSDKEIIEKLNAIKGNTKLKGVFTFDDMKSEKSWKEVLELGKDISNQDVVDDRKNNVKPDDLATLIYTSGTTGKPKGVQHNSAGYILWAQMTMEWVFDVKENDTYWCTADVGWITGHTYIVYGPLAMGATTVMFEGVITYPDAGRPWAMVENHRINQFYTAPTAIRVLHKMGEDEPKNYDLSSLKVLGTVGEPIDPPAWKWYYEEVGQSKCAIVDTYWQTETGGQVIAPLPGATPIKPACATLPLPGIMAEIIDEKGNTPELGEKGVLCITRPWPAMIRGVWGDEDRFVKAYFGDVKKDGKPVYFTGDGAVYDKDGYITITGRTDDVINVSGHRMGTAEVENAINEHPVVNESAVVGYPHPIKGQGIYAFVVCGELSEGGEAGIKNSIMKGVTKIIGPFAKPDLIQLVPDLPKTRSGKIMRRILRCIAEGYCNDLGDISTLLDTSIVEKIIKGALVEQEEDRK